MTRRKMPNRRNQVSIGFDHGGLSFVGSVGLYPDGLPGEVFLHCSKTTSGVEAVGRDAAILVSLALQHGCDLKTMRSAVTRDEGGGSASLIGTLIDVLSIVIDDLGAATADGPVPPAPTLGPGDNLYEGEHVPASQAEALA